MDYGDYEVMFPPSTYSAGNYMRYVFAVPQDNAVATNELDNAITLLEFKNDEDLVQKVVKKDFMEMVTGPFEFRFLPAWSDKEIAYSQSRGFLIVNIPDKTVKIHTIISGLDDIIENVKVLDSKNRTFVFEVNLPAAGLNNYKKVLRVIRFENDTFSVLAEHPAGKKTISYTEPWFVYQQKLFIYNDSTTKLDVFDGQFKPSAHPLADAFNQNNKSFRRLKEIIIHPTMSFALIIELGKIPDQKILDAIPSDQYPELSKPIRAEQRRHTLYLFRWTEPDEKKRFVPILSVAGSIWKSYNPVNNYSDFSISPDGKWLVFRDQSYDSKNPIFIAAPIDEKNPLYLGKPIKLGNALRGGAIGPTGTTWTTKPTAFVMCDGLALYRWNLDNYKNMKRVKMQPGSQDPFRKKGK
jgi:hypothetical protein